MRLLSGSTKEEWTKYGKLYVGAGYLLGFIIGFIWSLTYQFSIRFTQIISYWSGVFSISIITEAFTMLFGFFLIILFVGIFYGLIYLNKNRTVSSYVYPGQGIRNSWVNAGFFFLIAISPYLVAILVGMLVRIFLSSSLKDTLITEEIPFIISDFGILGGFGYVAWLIPGFACIQHFVQRFILWKNGYISWNYARFLDYATEFIFLQKVDRLCYWYGKRCIR